MPVYEITREKEKFNYIVAASIISTSLIFISFGTFCVFAWGVELETPLVTDMLPHNWIGWTIKLLFCVNLIFS